jgi:hypothetical protein
MMMISSNDSTRFMEVDSAPLIRRLFLIAVVTLLTRSYALTAQELRLGILGTDSSHAVEFTRILNDAAAVDHVAGAKVVVAYRGGSATLPFSRDRIQKFTDTLQKTWSIPFVASIAELCGKSDAILLLSVDTSARMRELGEAARCHKPIFVDKPLGGSLADARQVAEFLDQQHIAWFSSSSLRYGHEQHPSGVTGAETWGPGKYIEGFPLDLTYYGIHSIESLYSIMGPGVVQVARTRSKDTDVITATWADGRIGTARLIHPDSAYGSLIFHEKGPAVSDSNLQVGYGPLVAEIVQFVRTGKSPVAEAETLEIFAVMDAAQQSLQNGGAPVRVAGAASQNFSR